MIQRFATPALPRPRALTATAGLLLVALTMGSCALFSPGDEEVFVLVRVNEKPVPATALRLESPENGSWRELRFIQGRITLSADGRWTQTEESETVINGVASRSSWRMTGWYERTGDDLVLYYSGPGYNPGDGREAEILTTGQGRTLVIYSLFRMEYEPR